MRKINVSLVFARPERQWVFETTVMRGTNAQELIEISGFLEKIPELGGRQCHELTIGVYAEKKELDYLLEEGDRVEIYRPLNADPKEVRRQLALLGKTMGKRGSKS